MNDPTSDKKIWGLNVDIWSLRLMPALLTFVIPVYLHKWISTCTVIHISTTKSSFSKLYQIKQTGL